MTVPSRRLFLTTSAAAGVGLTELFLSPEAEAAAATRCRSFRSQWGIEKLALHLILGIGYQLAEILQELVPVDENDPKEILKHVKAWIKSGKLPARLETLKKDATGKPIPIHVELDQLNVLVDGRPLSQHDLDKRRHQLLVLLVLLGRKLKRGLEEGELSTELLRFLERIHGPFQHAIEHTTVTLEYRITFKDVVLYKRSTFQKGHVRLEADIRQPVNCLNCLHFSIDAQECDGQTTIVNTLGIDYNIGRREGPLVRRIAEREIGSREDYFLCMLEKIVYRAVHCPDDHPDCVENAKDLRRIVPEIIRRVAAQEM